MNFFIFGGWDGKLLIQIKCSWLNLLFQHYLELQNPWMKKFQDLKYLKNISLTDTQRVEETAASKENH